MHWLWVWEDHYSCFLSIREVESRKHTIVITVLTENCSSRRFRWLPVAKVDAAINRAKFRNRGHQLFSALVTTSITVGSTCAIHHIVSDFLPMGEAPKMYIIRNRKNQLDLIPNCMMIFFAGTKSSSIRVTLLAGIPRDMIVWCDSAHKKWM